MIDSSLDNPASRSGSRGAEKLARIPIRLQLAAAALPKPPWLRAADPGTPAVQALQRLLRDSELTTVCEEAACPNIGECFSRGTATFMIMGALCTRRCPFCDVAHGRPEALDDKEPQRLAAIVARMKLRYVVITAVDRDDLRDGGASHFADCIRAVREASPGTRVEILTPDFRGRVERALVAFEAVQPDIFNHNIETVPRLYREARPGADYAGSLALIRQFKARYPDVPTKAGLMLGLGESDEEVFDILRDLRDHDCDIVTLGQYLSPSRAHLPVRRYVSPAQFELIAAQARGLGFLDIVAGPLVRSSYHADRAIDLFDRAHA